MKITVHNIDRNLRVELSQLCEIVDVKDNPKGAFIEWATEFQGEVFTKQTKLIEQCVKKKIPMIIFDRHQKISPEEVSFLIGEGAFLWEPAVRDRNLFAYQPVWGRIITEPNQVEWDFEENRRFDLANVSTIRHKIPSFEKYYVPVHEIGGFTVGCHGIGFSQNLAYKMQSYEMPIYSADDGFMKNIKTTVLIGSEQHYETGFLDVNIFELLENGVIPLLPQEHRWYHAIFGDLVVYGEDNIEYLLKTYDNIGFGCVFEVYENLNNYLPESNVKNVAKRIVNYFS